MITSNHLSTNPAGLPTPLAAGPMSAKAARSARARYVVRRLLRSPAALAGATLTGFWILMAVAWPLFAPYNPDAVNPLEQLQAPSGAHLLGTDDLGRDVLSRILAGAGSILTVAPAATVLCITAGTVLGLVAGYYRGLLDDVLMRVVDAVISLPAIVVGVFVLGLLGPSTLNLVLVIGIIFTPFVSRTVRSTVLVERERSYVEAAQLRGERGFYVMFADILPNITGPIAVEATVRFGFAVFTASSLSFLGLGLQRPSPDWGLTIALEQVFIQVAPWTDLAPAAALASLLVGVYLLADSLQRVLEE